MPPTEHTFTSWDGTELFYRAWLPAGRADKAVLLFHRGHEHSGRWQETVEALGLADCAIFAWDARGHGRSPGARGSADNLGVLVRDTEAFARHLAARHELAPEHMVVVAHSVGAVTAAAWVHDYAPPLRGLVLATPAFRVKLYVPFAVPALRLKQKLLGPGYVKSYVKAAMLTHDAAQAAAYRADPLIFREIAVNLLLDLHDAGTRLVADAGALTVPTLLLAAGADWVVRVSAQRAFFDRLASPVKQWEMLDGFQHAIFHERGRARVVEKIRGFVRECFARPPQPLSLADADQRGHTKAEYDRLCAPGNPLYAVARAGLQTLGRLSQGVDLGWRHGFDSGLTLDYVYENRARGVTPLGRLFDRAYLDSIGWRGIRLRKANLQAVLGAALAATRSAGRPVRVLDIASGPGRYILETARALDPPPEAVRLRDYKPANVAAAQRLIAELGVPNATAELGDAFDRAALAAITPAPTVAVVSGLYELFPANAPLRASLAGLAEALAPGSFLIYTNQPWHPQVEFIARVLTNREGQPWIMRRRTQQEMDELVRAAGFEKIRQETDPWGIFTVSLARRA